jgi:hypothetical protein
MVAGKGLNTSLSPWRHNFTTVRMTLSICACLLYGTAIAGRLSKNRVVGEPLFSPTFPICFRVTCRDCPWRRSAGTGERPPRELQGCCLSRPGSVSPSARRSKPLRSRSLARHRLLTLRNPPNSSCARGRRPDLVRKLRLGARGKGPNRPATCVLMTGSLWRTSICCRSI